MKIFKKKYEEYKVHCDLDKTTQVRALAEKFAARNTVVETRAHGYLLAEKVRVTVTFKSEERKLNIYKKFLEEFNDYHVNISNNSITIRKETGLK